MFFFNRRISAGAEENKDQSISPNKRPMPKQIFFQTDFLENKYKNITLLKSITEYIVSKYDFFNAENIPSLNYCASQLNLIIKGDSVLPSLNGFISEKNSKMSKNTAYSKREIIDALKFLVQNDHIILYPVLISRQARGGKEELYGDFLLLAHKSNDIKFVLPYVKAALNRSLNSLINWIKKGDVSKYFKVGVHSSDLMKSFSNELRRLMYVAVIDPDNVHSLAGIENEFPDYNTVDAISKKLAEQNIIPKINVLFLEEVEGIDSFNRRAMRDDDKYMRVIESYPYIANQDSIVEDLAREYIKLFDFVKEDFNDYVKNKIVRNKDNIKLLQELEDFERDPDIQIPNIRYSEVLIVLIQRYLQQFMEEHNIGGNKKEYYVKRNTRDDDIYFKMSVFKSIHLRAKKMKEFKFYDLGAETLFKKVNNNVIDAAVQEPYEFYTQKEVDQLIQAKEERLKEEFKIIFNESKTDIVPFDYSEYQQKAEMKHTRLINTDNVKRIISYCMQFADDYYLLAQGLLFLEKEKEVSEIAVDPWLLGKMINLYEKIAASDGKGKNYRLSMIRDIAISCSLRDIFRRLNKINFYENRDLFEIEIKGILNEVKNALDIYNKNADFKNSKLLKSIDNLIKKKTDAMLSYKKELDKQESLFRFDPSKGVIGVATGLIISAALGIYINSIAGIVLAIIGSLVSSLGLSWGGYKLFGWIFRKRKKTVVEIENNNLNERRSETRNERIASRRDRDYYSSRSTATDTGEVTKKEDKKGTKEELDALTEQWKNLSGK